MLVAATAITTLAAVAALVIRLSVIDMIKNAYLICLAAILFAIIAGVIAASFVPKNHEGLYIGEEVRVKDSEPSAFFYNEGCKKMTIIGLQAVSDDNVAWVLLEGCTLSDGPIVTDVLSQSILEKK